MQDSTITLERTFEVKRQQEDCFRYIADFSTIAEWDHMVNTSKKLSAGAIGQGTKFELSLSFVGVDLPMTYEIIRYEYPDYVVLKGVGKNIVAIDRIRVYAKGSQVCRVNWQAELTFSGISAQLLPLTRSMIIKNGDKTIDGLQEALEDDFSLQKASQLANKFVLPAVWNFSRFGYKKAIKKWFPVSRSINSQHIVLTGPTAGLGKATAFALAAKGAELTLVGRDEAKLMNLKDAIQDQTGNFKLNIEVADLSLMEEVLVLGKRLLNRGKAVDVLINNAGALFNERTITEEGYEKSFALLLLAPYLLTEELMPLLEKAKQARIVNVSSGGMYTQRLDVCDMEQGRGKYNGSIAYAKAKRALVVLTEEWAKKYDSKDVIFHSMHPGWAETPGVQSSLPGFYKKTKPILRTPEEGADTIVWLASASEVSKGNGLFFMDRLIQPTHLSGSTKESSDERKRLMNQLEAIRAEVKDAFA